MTSGRARLNMGSGVLAQRVGNSRPVTALARALAVVAVNRIIDRFIREMLAFSDDGACGDAPDGDRVATAQRGRRGGCDRRVAAAVTEHCHQGDGPLLRRLMCNGLVGNGLGCNGLMCNGLERNGLECNGLECNGLECNGLECNGVMCHDLMCNGHMRNRLMCSGLMCNGVVRNGAWATARAPLRCVMTMMMMRNDDDAPGRRLARAR